MPELPQTTPFLNAWTPSQVADRICPIMKESTSTRVIDNDDMTWFYPAKCQGPKCMMWRWASTTHGNCGLATPHT